MAYFGKGGVDGRGGRLRSHGAGAQHAAHGAGRADVLGVDVFAVVRCPSGEACG